MNAATEAVSGSETRRRQAFRQLAQAREMARRRAPGADACYGAAADLTEQAIAQSENQTEISNGQQLRRIVNDDRRNYAASVCADDGM